MATVLLTNTLQASVFVIPGVRPILLAPGETKRFDASVCQLPELDSPIRIGYLQVIREDGEKEAVVETVLTTTIGREDTVEVTPESLPSTELVETMVEPLPVKSNYNSSRQKRK